MAHRVMLSKNPISERTRSIRRVLWIVLFLNLIVAFAKFIYGTVTGSTSMQADGIHSVFDSMGNVVGLVGIALAARPADEGHPYGHAKFETYTSVVIGVMLLFAAFEVGSTAVGKLVSGLYTTEVTPISFVIMVGTLFINLGVSRYERRWGRRLKSEILTADANHTLSDALVSTGVILGLAAVALGFPIADPLMALVVTVAILATAYDVFKRALMTLSDRARIPEADIRETVLSVPHVCDAHRIRTRGTEGEVYADLHVLVPSDMSVGDAHELADAVEHAIEARFPTVIEVLVHIEPDDGHEE